MKITMETDYAMRIMRSLAKRGRSDAKTVSDDVNAPLRFTVKILGKLSSARLVNSFKGVGGGYELSRPADEISLRDIYEVTEGPLSISRCSEEGFVCPHGSDDCDCFFNRIFDEINGMIAGRLGTVTIADALRKEST